jgi:predicted nucleic acid-binding protein
MAHMFLADRIWSLSHNLGACGACSVALAEAPDAPPVTCDGKQARAEGHHAQVETFALRT